MRVHRTGAQIPLALTLLIAIMACGLLTAAARVAPTDAAHQQAGARWERHAPASYRIALRVEALERVCYQQLEVRAGWVRQTLLNTCDEFWMDVLTVDALFDLGREIEELPGSRCARGGQGCVCHRVFLQRGVYYDAQLGFPETILARSEMRWNWTSPDFWRAVAEERELPSCAPALRRLTVQVLALNPIE